MSSIKKFRIKQKQESPPNAKGTRDSSAHMKAHCCGLTSVWFTISGRGFVGLGLLGRL